MTRKRLLWTLDFHAMNGYGIGLIQSVMSRSFYGLHLCLLVRRGRFRVGYSASRGVTTGRSVVEILQLQGTNCGT